MDHDLRLPEGSGRISFRPLHEPDAAWLARAWASPELRPYLGDSRPTEVRQVRRLILRRREAGNLDVVVVLEGRDVGRASLQSFTERGAEIEIEIPDPADRRRGIGRAALEALIAHAFGPMGLERLEARILASNTASLALARELGFLRIKRSSQPQGPVITVVLQRRVS